MDKTKRLVSLKDTFYKWWWSTNGWGGLSWAYEEIFWKARNSSFECQLLYDSGCFTSFCFFSDKETCSQALSIYNWVADERKMVETKRKIQYHKCIDGTHEEIVYRGRHRCKDAFTCHYNHFTSTKTPTTPQWIHVGLCKDCIFGFNLAIWILETKMMFSKVWSFSLARTRNPSQQTRKETILCKMMNNDPPWQEVSQEALRMIVFLGNMADTDSMPIRPIFKDTSAKPGALGITFIQRRIQYVPHHTMIPLSIGNQETCG